MDPAIKPENPLALLQAQTQKLPVGCPILTRLLRGGIPVGSVTELSGESGSGKTQLSLQLLLSSPPPSIFIHSEFPFPLRRLLTLTRSRPHPPALDRILVSGAHSPYDLLALLSHARSSLLPRSPPIKLIVIDSIAALFRSEFDNTAADLKRRSNLFFKIASQLKEIAVRFQLAVVVTNQVVDVVGSEEGGAGGGGVRIGNFRELWSSGRRIWPALGISWANCVNMRLFLSRNDEVVRREEGLEFGEIGGLGDDGGVVMRTRRTIQVVFAPHLPESSSEFVIVKEGVFGYEPKWDFCSHIRIQRNMELLFIWKCHNWFSALCISSPEGFCEYSPAREACKRKLDECELQDCIFFIHFFL